MLEVLEQELDEQKIDPNLSLVCEIGSGSGIIAAWLARALVNSLLIATDVNGFACRSTKQTIEANGNGVGLIAEIVQASYVDGIRGPFDLIVFNPPYVPTLAGLRRTPLDLAWDGGDERGRLVIDGFVARLPVSDCEFSLHSIIWPLSHAFS